MYMDRRNRKEVWGGERVSEKGQGDTVMVMRLTLDFDWKFRAVIDTCGM